MGMVCKCRYQEMEITEGQLEGWLLHYFKRHWIFSVQYIWPLVTIPTTLMLPPGRNYISQIPFTSAFSRWFIFSQWADIWKADGSRNHSFSSTYGLQWVRFPVSSQPPPPPASHWLWGHGAKLISAVVPEAFWSLIGVNSILNSRL